MFFLNLEKSTDKKNDFYRKLQAGKIKVNPSIIEGHCQVSSHKINPQKMAFTKQNGWGSPIEMWLARKGIA